MGIEEDRLGTRKKRSARDDVEVHAKKRHFVVCGWRNDPFGE
jgi:hypothetical protein